MANCLKCVETKRDCIFLYPSEEKGITFEGEVREYPRYSKWSSYKRYLRLVQEQFQVDEDRAACMLHFPEESEEILFEENNELLRKIHEIVAPFEEYEGVTFERLKWIFKKFGLNRRWLSFQAPMWAERLELKEGDVENFLEMVEIIDLHVFDFDEEKREAFFSVVKETGFEKWSLSELKCLAYFGFTTPKLARLYERNPEFIWAVYGLDGGKTLRKKLPNLSEEYILPKKIGAFIRVEDLVRGGLTLAELFPYLTKKERAAFYEKEAKETYIKWPLFAEAVQFRYPEMPKHWIDHIKNMKVADWAWQKRAQLAKSRVVYGPAGRRAVVHYHELLREITPDMLPNGPKTSWRKVFDRLEERVKRRIMYQLGKNTPLAELPLKEFPKGVKPILTTWELRDEGERMEHCAAGYAEACLLGETFILHCGPPAPEGATAEICLRQGKWQVLQIKARENEEPEPQYKVLAFEVTRRLNDEKNLKSYNLKLKEI